MNDGLQYGNRLIMLHQGHIAVDIKGEDKQRLIVDKLMHLFQQSVDESLSNDKLLLQ